MKGKDPDEPLVRASRSDYESMARLAKELLQQGRSPREVLRLMYGVEFPEEFLLLAQAGPWNLGLAVEYSNQPWKFATRLEDGGPSLRPDSMDKYEQKILALNPQLLPLARLRNRVIKHGDSVICYHLGELAANRATIFGIQGVKAVGEEAVRYGESLLTVLHEHHVDRHRQLLWEYRLPSNRGAGSVDRDDVEEAAKDVEKIESLQQQLARRNA